MDELDIACDDCRSRFEITDNHERTITKNKQKKNKQKKNVLERHNDNYITLGKGSRGGWAGNKRYDEKTRGTFITRYTTKTGLAATSKLNITLHDLVTTSQISDGNEIKWGTPLYGFTFSGFTDLVRTQVKEVHDEKNTIEKKTRDVLMKRPEFKEGVDPVVVSLSLVRDNLSKPLKGWDFTQHRKFIVDAIVKNLTDIIKHIESDGQEGCDRFIFEDVGAGEDYEMDYTDHSFRKLQRKIEEGTFSMRAECLALYLFLCEKRGSDTWNVPMRFIDAERKSTVLAKDRIEKIERAAINHGAMSMWCQLVHDHRQEFITREYFGDKYSTDMEAIERIDIEDKKVCLSLISWLIYILTMHDSNSHISNTL